LAATEGVLLGLVAGAVHAPFAGFRADGAGFDLGAQRGFGAVVGAKAAVGSAIILGESRVRLVLGNPQILPVE
jgi:hypothetical protein